MALHSRRSPSQLGPSGILEYCQEHSTEYAVWPDGVPDINVIALNIFATRDHFSLVAILLLCRHATHAGMSIALTSNQAYGVSEDSSDIEIFSMVWTKVGSLREANLRFSSRSFATSGFSSALSVAR
jgi:hypothetical protein